MPSQHKDITSETVDTKTIEEEEMLMKNLSRLLLGFGSAITIGMIIVLVSTLEVRAEVVVLGMLVGTFMIAIAIAINKSVGFSIRELLPRKIPHMDSWLRVRTEEEVLARMPMAYLVLSGLIMLICSACMIVGDINLTSIPYRELTKQGRGGHFVFTGCAIIFITVACLGFILATMNNKKHLKTIMIWFFLANLAAFIASAVLNFSYYGMHHYDNVEISRRLMLKDVKGHFIKGQDYPNGNIPMWLIMKFASAEVIMGFSCFNIIFSSMAFVTFKKRTKKSSLLFGIIGTLIIATTLALEVILDLLLMSNIKTSGYSWSLQLIRPIVAIATLQAGIHAFYASYSASNLRKFGLLILSTVVIVASVFAGIAVYKFHSEALKIDTIASQMCETNPDYYLYCVHNSTGSDQVRYSYEEWNQGVSTSPNLACIEREKFCNGKADLFIDKMDSYFHSYRHYKTHGYRRNDRLYFCGDTEYDYDISNPAPIDEVACYTGTPLPSIVIATFGILAVNMICAFAIFVATCTSLPPALRLVLSALAWLFGTNYKHDLNEDDGGCGTETEELNP